MIIIDYDKNQIITENPYQYISDNYGIPSAIFLQSYANSNNLLSNSLKPLFENKYNEIQTLKEIEYKNSSAGLSNTMPKKLLSIVTKEKLKEELAFPNNDQINTIDYLSAYDTNSIEYNKKTYCKTN